MLMREEEIFITVLLSLFSGVAMFAIAIGCSIFGFWRIMKGNRKRRLLRFEDLEARIALMPLMQAEHDRNVRLKETLCLFQVGEIMYHSDRWRTPLNEELFNLRPSKELADKKLGFHYYV
ncbi:hypothetical protein DNTS_012313 [Danionella cerebrum]|uniref:NADH dehydrogenase [ubiquinone] 1 alpha subcomplex subunit 13 n=1 Tax=Danionella cerebrum TaxID=2873325 RepID=A0A553RES4_9TELE|nr:hypothetical protein DNTS_012313 [Danionella translucida]